MSARVRRMRPPMYRALRRRVVSGDRLLLPERWARNRGTGNQERRCDGVSDS